MKTLVVLGDSWPAGIEVPDPHINAFPNKIGKILNFDNVINVSEGASSLAHLLLQLKKFESVRQITQTDHHAEYIFLICMTSAVRSLYFDSIGEPKEIIPTDRSKVAYYADSFHWPETAKFNWYQAVVMMQGYCRKKHYKDFYVQMFDNPPLDNDYNKLINFERIYKSATSNMKDYLFSLTTEETSPTFNLSHGPFLSDVKNTEAYKKYFAPNEGHPNIVGHQLIAEEISRFINEKIDLNIW